MTTLPKGKTIGTTNLQLGELIHMEFDLYNGTSFQVYTSMSTVVYANTIILWIFPTVSKGAQVLTIFFILTTLNNEQHPCIRKRVNKDSEFENSTYLPTF